MSALSSSGATDTRQSSFTKNLTSRHGQPRTCRAALTHRGPVHASSNSEEPRDTHFNQDPA